MKQYMTRCTALLPGLAALLCLTLWLPTTGTGAIFLQQPPATQSVVPARYKPVVDAFEARVKEYVKQREQIEGKLPKLSKDSTPEQIEAHKDALQRAVRAARSGSKQGDIFTPEVADYIRATIKYELSGRDKQEVRTTALEAETKDVPLRVNYPYPETKELVEMPPTLLLKLPQLPKQVRYRYVGRHMLLVDRENGLIIDYMLNALP